MTQCGRRISSDRVPAFSRVQSSMTDLPMGIHLGSEEIAARMHAAVTSRTLGAWRRPAHDTVHHSDQLRRKGG